MSEIHDQLAHDLALTLSKPPRGTARGRLTWENIEFPDLDRCRPDVYSIYATLSPAKWQPITFEVKAFRSDLLSDLRSGKWQKYYPISAYVVFAVPDGLCLQKEIPAEAGLIVKKRQGWIWEARGRHNKEWLLTPRQWMNLCLKGRNPSPLELFQRGIYRG